MLSGNETRLLLISSDILTLAKVYCLNISSLLSPAKLSTLSMYQEGLGGSSICKTDHIHWIHGIYNRTSAFSASCFSVLSSPLRRHHLTSCSFVLLWQYINPIVRNSKHPLKGDLLYAVERVLKLSVPNLYVWLCMFYCFFHLWYVASLLF